MGLLGGLFLLVVLAVVAHVLDWRQTLTIARSQGRWVERLNPVLGRAPSTWQVHWWFSLTAVALLLFVALASYAVLWLAYLISGLWLLVELWVVRRNHFLGIGV